MACRILAVDKRYRSCRECGKEWNVSRVGRSEKVYICPKCEYQKRKNRPGTAIPKAAIKSG